VVIGKPEERRHESSEFEQGVLLIPSEDGRESYDHSEALPEAKGSHPSDHDLAAVHAPNHHRA
jgi:hypothetical protein